MWRLLKANGAISAAEPSLGEGQQCGDGLHTTEGTGKHPSLCLIHSQAPPTPGDYKGLCISHVKFTRFSGKCYVALGSLAQLGSVVLLVRSWFAEQNRVEQSAMVRNIARGAECGTAG